MYCKSPGVQGSVFAYNPAMNEAEWVPVCGLANDLTWAEEWSSMALANYVPHIPAEATWIAMLGACWIVSCPDDSSTLEEEEAQHRNPWTTDTEPKHDDESVDGADQNDPRKKWSQTDDSTPRTGRQSWSGLRGWPMITRSRTLWLQ